MPSNKLSAVFSIALILLGCASPPGRPLKPPSGTAAPSAGAAPHGGAYRFDADQSELRVLVFRAGPMALLGHDHVIVNRALAGWVDQSAEPGSVRFHLEVPVAAFAVDEPSARLAEGADFAGEISDDARQSTRQNMLGPALLDAAAFPRIVVESNGVESNGVEGAATLSIAVGGHESKQRVPFVLARSAARLILSADFRLLQSSLGLKPFSVMMGALQVQDEFRVKLKLVATLASGKIDARGIERGGAGQGRDDDRGPFGREQ